MAKIKIIFCPHVTTQISNEWYKKMHLIFHLGTPREIPIRINVKGKNFCSRCIKPKDLMPAFDRSRFNKDYVRIKNRSGLGFRSEYVTYRELYNYMFNKGEKTENIVLWHTSENREEVKKRLEEIHSELTANDAKLKKPCNVFYISKRMYKVI